ASAGNARRLPRPRKPGLKSKSRGLETTARAAVERREASAPEAGGSRKRIVRGARRARSAGRWRHLFVWCGSFDLRLPALRLPFLFGGETAGAFVLAAKLGRAARRENAVARTFRPRAAGEGPPPRLAKGGGGWGGGRRPRRVGGVAGQSA